MTPSLETPAASAGSFRDPSGRVFIWQDRIYRQIDRSYARQYDHLIRSGLHQRLVDERLLVSSSEVVEPAVSAPETYRVIEAERIPFISYPFEWSFGELKVAALATLRLHRIALDFGMVLKDASAYNIQFRGPDPVLIDTLSFELWQDGAPWAAYRQFCQHFLGPLAVMSRDR